jgi:Uma2 family endonuclease
MSVTSSVPSVARPEPEPEQRFTLQGVPWDSYVSVNETLGARSYPRMIYCDGRLTFMTRSRLHEWLVDCLGDLVKIVATGCEITWETAGETTFRRRDRDTGLEGDTTFYFGANAEHMRGPKNVDMGTDPPPDLAIEVEVSHSAVEALEAWGRLGVPEVWRFNASAWSCTFWHRNEAGTYVSAPHSQFLPMLKPAEIADQMRQAQNLGASRWYAQLPGWVRDVLRPRLDQEGC